MLKTKQAALPDTEGMPASDEAEMTEERMRRALGLGAPGSQRTLTLNADPTQFAGSAAMATSSPNRGSVRTQAAAAHGEVLSPLHQRVAELEGQLAAERQRHDEVRRLLQRTELTVRTLETRSQHETLTRQEELDAERRATMRAQRALDDALFEMQQRENARQAAKVTTPLVTRPAPTDKAELKAPSVASKPKVRVADSSPPKKRGRPRSKSLPEPKPVRWWTPSYRAKVKTKD